jgi:histidyl-tRNA synthetase
VKFQIVKGTQDILPDDIHKWRYVETTAARILENFGYQEIRTPLFECTALFTRSIGETTDIVEKEMYSFKDRKGRDISLRPEGTAPIIRAYIEHGISSPAKFYHLGPMYRYERPQKGRNREFYQIGVEAIGSTSPFLDAEVIDLGQYLLKEIGLRDVQIKLNSIGCRRCRPRYKQALLSYIEKTRSKLCNTCQTRVAQNPFRILDCKERTCRKLVSKAPVITDSLCGECRHHFEKVKTHLQRLGIQFTVDPRLFRGLDYYSKTTFEFISNALGAKDTILGGGRYDYLVGELGGEETPATGWALGVDRLILALEGEKFQFPRLGSGLTFVAWTSETTKDKSMEITRMLRQEGISSQTDYDERSLKSQLKLANRMGADYTVIVGDEELADGKVLLRDMNTGAQEAVLLSRLEEVLKKRCSLC